MRLPQASFNLQYTAVPTMVKFHASNAFVRGIMGPIGSGKSVGMVLEMYVKCLQQRPNKEKRRCTRWAVIRNTYPELKSTAIKTFQDWITTAVCTMNWGSPITARIVHEVGDGTILDAEIFFLALDKPQDVKKLLSLELTGAWINEAREIQKEVVDAVVSRVGRFPGKRDGGATWSGVIMDTNPTDDDHWWYSFAEEDAWRTNDPLDVNYTALANLLDEKSLKKVKSLTDHLRVKKIESDWEFFRQPGALLKVDGNYILNPDAENVDNIEISYAYWVRMLTGKSDEWINVYVLGRYGSLFTGRPVYGKSFDDKKHVSDKPLAILRGLPIYLGWDFGLDPACIIGQISSLGQLRVLREYIGVNIGLRQFIVDIVKPALANEFSGFTIYSFGDPSGAYRGQVDAATPLGELAAHGIPTQAAPTNLFLARRESVLDILNRITGGDPAFILDPSCTVLRKGFNGGYHFKRVLAPGSIQKYHDKPNKNAYSHPHDGLQYLVLGLDSSYTVESVTSGKAYPTPSAEGVWEGMT